MMAQHSQDYRVKLAKVVKEQLRAIADERVCQLILDAIAALSHDPEHQGKPLLGEFAGYRSLRAAGQRYRIIYKVDGDQVMVYVVFVGLRRQDSSSDIYEQARMLLP